MYQYLYQQGCASFYFLVQQILPCLPFLQHFLGDSPPNPNASTPVTAASHSNEGLDPPRRAAILLSTENAIVFSGFVRSNWQAEPSRHPRVVSGRRQEAVQGKYWDSTTSKLFESRFLLKCGQIWGSLQAFYFSQNLVWDGKFTHSKPFSRCRVRAVAQPNFWATRKYAGEWT